MIERIIKPEVCIFYQRHRLRWIKQTEALIVLTIMQKLNPIIVLLDI